MTEMQKRTYPPRLFYEVWLVMLAYAVGVLLDDWWMRPWYHDPGDSLDMLRKCIAIASALEILSVVGMGIGILMFAFHALSDVYRSVDKVEP